MKKIIPFLFSLLFISLSARAQSLQNEINLEKEFQQLNKIEYYVDKHEGVTLQLLEEQNSVLLDDIVIEKESNSASFLTASDTLGIPPFWWGFCLGFWGILIVYIISDNDRAATKKALNGCLTIGLATAAIYVILFAVGILATNSSYYYY